MAQQAADRLSARPPDYVDDDVVVISGPEFKGLVVLPRLHIVNLEALSTSCRANVLAALQRAARVVREENPWSEARIFVLTDLPGSEGHLCIRVLPGDVDDATDSSSRST
ncbi:MAG: hypothetical protein WAL61_04735 [Acidimicrobiales bacterium]